MATDTFNEIVGVPVVKAAEYKQTIRYRLKIRNTQVIIEYINTISTLSQTGQYMITNRYAGGTWGLVNVRNWSAIEM